MSNQDQGGISNGAGVIIMLIAALLTACLASGALGVANGKTFSDGVNHTAKGLGYMSTHPGDVLQGENWCISKETTPMNCYVKGLTP